MNFMIQLNLHIYLMQVVQVDDKVEHILHGGCIIIYQNIISISPIKNTEAFLRLIIAQ